MKRKILILLSIVLLIVCMPSLCSCQDKEEEEQKTILFLGDSIAEALLGPSPITERDSYGYYSIIGQINDYQYINRAVSGATVGYFWEALSSTEEYEGTDGFARSYWIEEADIIVISMLGNDLLGGDMIEWALETGENYTLGKEEVAEEFQEKLDNKCTRLMNQSLELIREKNPTAPIIWQTLYNPFYDGSPLLTKSDIEALQNKQREGKISETMTYRFFADKLVNALNKLVYTYQETHDNFYVCDVFTAYDEVFCESEEKGKELVFSDGIHPSTVGHALIADTLEKTLSSLSLSDSSSATAQYKTLVSDRLDRLYASSALDVGTVKNKINNAKTIKEVSEIYFSETENIDYEVKSNVTPYENPTLFEEDRTYYINSVQLSGTELYSIDFSSIDFEEMGLPNLSGILSGELNILDAYGSYFEFTEDGKATIKITLGRDIITLLNTINGLGLLSWINVADILDSEFAPAFHTTYNMYFTEMFPGFDITDLDGCLDLLSSVGVQIEGIDRESADYKKLCNSLRTDGTIPSDITFPTQLGISISGYYTMQQITGDKPCTAVYLKLVNTTDDTVPMFCFAVTEETDEISKMNFKIEFAHVKVEASLEK